MQSRSPRLTRPSYEQLPPTSRRSLTEITELTLRNSVIYDRFADTAALSRNDARALGCLGYVARASGMATDARLTPIRRQVNTLTTFW